MQIDTSSNLVNTEKLRVKKLSPQFWDALHKVTNLNKLVLISCDGVSETISEIAKLCNLKELVLAQVDIDESISELQLSETVTSLTIKGVECSNWSLLPVLPQIIEFKHNRLFTSDVVQILFNLPNVRTAELEVWDDDELNDVVKLIQNNHNINTLKLRFQENVSFSGLSLIAAVLTKQSIILEIEYEGPIADDEISKIMKEEGVKFTFVPNWILNFKKYELYQNKNYIFIISIFQ